MHAAVLHSVKKYYFVQNNIVCIIVCEFVKYFFDVYSYSLGNNMHWIYVYCLSILVSWREGEKGWGGKGRGKEREGTREGGGGREGGRAGGGKR